MTRFGELSLPRAPAPYEVNAAFEGSAIPSVDVEVLLHDTALLSPAGHQTLASIGSVIGLPKLEVGDYIERMDDLLKDDPTRFCEYAMRDAVTTLVYWLAVHAITQQTLAPRVFHTVGAISAAFLGSYLKKGGLTRKGFYGRGHSNFRRFDSFAVDAYHGGRNESICVGFINERLYDLDLSGAYSIGMAHLPTLDFSKAYVTTEIDPFLAVDAVGFAEVRFQFPSDVGLPCLPVKTKRGLVYPLSGVTHCTAYELCLAARLGAVLEVESGLIIPPATGPGEPVLKRFVRDIRLERSKHPKGSLYNAFYKLILNSLYGKFAQGVNPKKYFNARTGQYDLGGRGANTNPYLAALITGFIRAVLSELAHELTARGFIVVSMTTDGLLTNAPLEFILRNVKTPFVEAYKSLVKDSGGHPDGYLELKASTERLFSWKTRGQYALDHGAICALAGLQKPRGGHEAVGPWLLENVANRGVKTLNEIHRLTSLLEVYKGSPFGDVRMLKYISTQFDFKRRPAPYKEECVSTKPWSDVKEMETWLKRYVDPFPYKVNTGPALNLFEGFISAVEGRRKAERRRKRRVEEDYRVRSLYPQALRLCARAALQGAAGFSRKFTSREVVNFLRVHGIRTYPKGASSCPVDSNFCKNQARRPVTHHRLALTVDVLTILRLFTELDGSFNPGVLLLDAENINGLSAGALKQLDSIKPQGVENLAWAADYLSALTRRADASAPGVSIGGLVARGPTEAGGVGDVSASRLKRRGKGSGVGNTPVSSPERREKGSRVRNTPASSLERREKRLVVLTSDAATAQKGGVSWYVFYRERSLHRLAPDELGRVRGAFEGRAPPPPLPPTPLAPTLG